MSADNIGSRLTPSNAPPGHAAPKADGRRELTPAPGQLRRIGIHGARGTGKTCYLACLYGQRAAEAAAVTFCDDESIDHLKAAWGVLERGEVPDATALTLPTELRLAVHSGGLGWSASTRDYAGTLVQRSDTGVPELKEEVREWLASCHAVLLFLNIEVRDDARDSAVRERHDELDLLLTHLRKLSPDGNTIGRPLALLLTKWDVQGAVSGDEGQEKRRAMEYLRGRPALRQIADGLKNCGDRVEVFPVSAFGAHRHGNKPPDGGPRPFGLHAPLVWALEKADEMLFERARREADRCAGPHRRWWERRYGRAVRAYRELIEGLGVNKGPITEKARQELKGLETRRNRRWALLSGAVLSLTAVLVLCGLYWQDALEYDRTRNCLADVTRAPETVKHDCDLYAGSWNPFAHVLGHSGEIKEKEKAYREGREEQEFTGLEDFCKRNGEGREAGECDEKCEEFLRRWPGSTHASGVMVWKAEHHARAVAYQRELDFDREYHALEEMRLKLGDNYEKFAAECEGFLKRFPKNQYGSRGATFDKVERMRESCKAAGEEKEWAEVVNYERQNPKNFDAIIKRAEAYYNKPGREDRQKKTALDTIELTKVRWDRSEYEKVRAASQAAQAAGDFDSVSAAENMARQYLSSTHPIKRCQTEVRQWVNWVEGLKAGQDYYFTIKSVYIPTGSHLDWFNNDTKVYGQFNGAAFDTGWGFFGNNPQIEKKMGPVPFRLGTPATLELTVEKYFHIAFSNARAVGKVENDRFLLSKLNGTFVATCSKNKQVEVRLECPAAVPPSLPPYPDK